MNEHDIRVTAMASDQTAVAHVTAGWAPRKQMRAEGHAKCHPTDKPVPKVGLNIAIARALENLAKQYHKQAEKERKQG